MKLKSRRRRNKMKLWGQVSRGQSVTSLRFIHSRALPLSPPHLVHARLPRLRPSATDRKSQPPSYPHSSCSASPFLLHKITEAAERKRSGQLPLFQLADPASRSSCSGAPSSPAGLCPPGGPLVLHRLRFLRSLGAVPPRRVEP